MTTNPAILALFREIAAARKALNNAERIAYDLASSTSKPDPSWAAKMRQKFEKVT